MRAHTQKRDKIVNLVKDNFMGLRGFCPVLVRKANFYQTVQAA